MECAGPACTNDFAPKRSTARYCSTTCRSRANRARKAAEAAAEVDAQAAGSEKDGDAEHQLVTVTRRELTEAGVLDTVNGQLALNLARKLVDVDAKGVASLTKELRTVLAEAKAGRPAPTTGGDDDANGAAEGEEPEDEVTAARRAREEARKAAGLA